MKKKRIIKRINRLPITIPYPVQSSPVETVGQEERLKVIYEDKNNDK